jgi:Fic family protein
LLIGNVLDQLLNPAAEVIAQPIQHIRSRVLAPTALRDINELLSLGILRKCPAGGRSTSYEIND